MFTDNEKQQLQEWYNNLSQQRHSRNNFSGMSQRQNWIKANSCPLGAKIKSIYEEGYGFKTLAKNLDLTYMVCRKLCIDYIGIEYRKGMNVITDVLRKTRSENAKGEKSNLYDWPRRMPELCSKNSKSIQGYYKKKDSSKVWLRSTYEYIMSKWLDKLDMDWKIEENCYVLSNGERYRPDFFVYENNILKIIIEVKSRYFNKDNREYKFHMFKEEYGLECMLITDITKFTDKTYHQELKEWKLQRLLEN
jgi:hypothetical protein